MPKMRRKPKHSPIFFPTIGTLIILISLISIYLLLFRSDELVSYIKKTPPVVMTKTNESKTDTINSKAKVFTIPPDAEMQKPEILIYKVGEIVKFSNASIKLEDAVYGTEIKSSLRWMPSCTTETGLLVKIKLYYKNTGNEPSYVSNFNLYDANNRRFEAESSSCLENQIYFTNKLNPGLELTFESLYEIPKDAKELKLQLSEMIYISLGF